MSTGLGRGWCLAVDVPEIMQRLFQQMSDRRGCNGRRCTVHPVHRTVEFHRSSSLLWCLSVRSCATTGAVATLLAYA